MKNQILLNSDVDPDPLGSALNHFPSSGTRGTKMIKNKCGEALLSFKMLKSDLRNKLKDDIIGNVLLLRANL